MSEEKWKSPSGHPISSSETDNVELKPCPFEWFTRRLNEIGPSRNKNDGVSFYMSPMDIERVNEAYKAWNARANEPDTVSVDGLKICNETVTEKATLRKQAWNSCIDHLRKQHPNGIKWRQ